MIVYSGQKTLTKQIVLEIAIINSAASYNLLSVLSYTTGSQTQIDRLIKKKTLITDKKH